MRIRFGSSRSVNFFLAPDLAVRKVDDHSDYFTCLISDECDTSRVTWDEEGVGTLRSISVGVSSSASCANSLSPRQVTRSTTPAVFSYRPTKAP